MPSDTKAKGIRMFSTLKIAHVAHLVGLKVFTAKTVVGLGMVAGTAATGYMVSGDTQDDYIDRTILLINHAVAAEPSVMGSASLMPDVGMHRRVNTDLATGLATLAQAQVTLMPASRLRLHTGPIGGASSAGDLITERRAVETRRIRQPSAIGN